MNAACNLTPLGTQLCQWMDYLQVGLKSSYMWVQQAKITDFYVRLQFMSLHYN